MNKEAKHKIPKPKKVNGKGKGPVLEYFHPARIALQTEIKHHARLIDRLGIYHTDDFSGKIGEVAAYCNIALDGMYTPEDLDNLCDILVVSLRKKRTIILQ